MKTMTKEKEMESREPEKQILADSIILNKNKYTEDTTMTMTKKMKLMKVNVPKVKCEFWRNRYLNYTMCKYYKNPIQILMFQKTSSWKDSMGTHANSRECGGG